MNIYQEEILDHYQHPRHRGTIANPTATASMDNPACGDTLTVSVRIGDGVITEISFDGEGCAISQAAASMLMEELAGKPLKTAQAFSDAEMFELIGVELTPARQKCGLLAVSSLRKALADLRDGLR